MVKRTLTTICLSFGLALSLGAASPVAINPRDYGVTFSGADDTAGWQAAINAAIDEGLPLAAPCGTSAVMGALTIDGSMTFAGGGLDCTFLAAKTPNLDIITVTTPQAVHFRDFTIDCLGASQVQYAIAYYAPSARNVGSTVTHVRLNECHVGLDMLTNSDFVIDGAFISSTGWNVGIRVADVNWPDYGDGVIANSTIINGTQQGYAILQYNGGGLKVATNKIYGYQYGYLLSLQGATSELQIIGNNFDHSAYCIGGISGFPLTIVANNLCR